MQLQRVSLCAIYENITPKPFLIRFLIRDNRYRELVVPLQYTKTYIKYQC